MSTSRRLATVATAVLAAAAALAATSMPAGSSAATGAGSSTSRGVARAAAPAAGVDDSVHLNEIQVIGTHNSYHVVPPDDEEALRRQFIHEGADLMQYSHKPLPVQFQNQKVRQIELDVWMDSKGGLFSKPLLRDATGKGPWHPEVMDKPGIKVLHIQDVDYVSTCLTFVDCLTEVKTWSDANPSHVPIAILLELKDDPLDFGGLTFTTPEPWTAAAMDTLDDTIRSVMTPDDLITPDDVRGSHATLEEAVLAHDAWPTLGESRGKVMFLMDNGSRRETYLQGHEGLQGRVLFTNADPGDPDAAFVEMNDSSQTAAIQDLVRKGYVVRSRADGDTTEARENNTGPRDAALASGAQWVSTDYPVANIAVGFTTPYVAEIPGGTVARCNPVNAPAGCDSAALDTIFTSDPLPVPTPTTAATTTTTAAPTTTTAPVTHAGGATAVPARPSYTG
jgi:hypothetical protein